MGKELVCRYLSYSGISGRVVTLSPCSSHSDHRKQALVVTGEAPPCRGKDIGFEGGSQRKREREIIENLDESEMISSKYGPIFSLSGSPKFQATAAPGPREEEIVEHFRKVQTELRERAAVKEEKKSEASQGKSKESETVDSLLKLLRKHSVEQGKKNNSRDLNLDNPEVNGSYSEDQSSSFFGSNDRARNMKRISILESHPAADHVHEIEEEIESESEPELELESESIYQEYIG
ncbi:mitochondrial inner membrane protease subunit 1-like isoform X1 [Hibiscus syriacus]|uniref:Mitochondrial inner membrane protease subunit 1-like isoform X1 n=1 Tax=Hibiscus syriacus TaxID=106335 RepID=A0A6A2XBU6_HIBSY|nr:mitochondrial inner membrane protease subunit 1-like isoform X1 [Hibiscus syriacus]